MQYKIKHNIEFKKYNIQKSKFPNLDYKIMMLKDTKKGDWMKDEDDHRASVNFQSRESNLQSKRPSIIHDRES
jgi:hypothetical protein